MDTITRLLILSMCVCAHCEPLGDAIQQRSDSFGIYASQYTQDYEPYIFAAVPLHPPMPILHVLSPKPLAPPKRDHHRASSAHHSTYARPSYARPPYADTEHARPSYSQSAYRPSHTESEYVRPSYAQKEFAPISYDPSDYEHTYAQAHMHPTSVTHLTYVKPPHQADSSAYPASQESQTILYARPNVHGGYSYHKQPTKTSHAPKRPPTTESPVILRVHKYRIVKSR